MKKQRILSLLLCLALLSAAMLTGGSVAAAEDTKPDSGLVLNKTATANGDGTYTITLEAYATGAKTTSTVTKDVPTDIVLVLDLSSSMNDQIGTVSYSAYSNKNNEALYALRHNGGEGNLWHKVGDSYYSVSVTAEGRTPSYTNADNYTNSSLYNNQNNLYAKIGEEYVKVTVTRSENRWNYTYTYTYTYGGEEKNVTSSGSDSKPSFDDGVSLHVLSGVDSTNATYTYTYTDSTGTKTITTSTGGTTTPAGATFYSRSTSTSGGGTRLEALKTACTNFADAVAAKCTTTAGTTVNHRIAIVGFNKSETRYTGTSDATALIDMSTSTGASTVKTAINKLSTSQGTVPATGLAMANSIFAANPLPTGETRNRVVILFTDGYPSTSGSDNFDSTLADNAITQADTAKNNHKATVYTIAVIAGADPTSAGNSGGTNPEKVNWFLQTASSNNGIPQTPSYYLSASDAASLNNIFQQISEQIETGGSSTTLNSNAVVKDIMSPYFTLPAGTTASNITIKTYKYNGNSYTAENAWTENSDTMGATAEVVDGNVSVTGFDFSANWCGTESQTGTAGNVTYRGNKLVISFNVTPRPGFLGGNNVPTNGADSGVYENADAETAIENFVVPQVNVQLGSFEVAVQEKNVYLTNDLTQADMLTGATVTLKDWSGNPVAAFDYTETGVGENYGLESWQNAFVDLSVRLPAGQTRLMTDSSYTLSASINRKGETDATPAVGTAVINVFKPELTFKDGTVDYKSVISNTGYKSDNTDKTYESDNFVSSETKWTHGEGDAKKTSTDEGVTMLGTAPELTRAYAPTSGVDTNNIVTSTTYVPVKATVAIKGEDVTSHTAFIHECDAVETGKCEWDTLTPAPAGGAPAFLLHVINVVGDLKITKTDLNQHTYATGDNESAIFTVTGENNETWTVAINGNDSVTLTGLQVGSYTVTELNDWTWRYADQNAQTAEVVGGNTAKVTFNNIHSNQKWLGGDNFAKNVFTGSSDVLAEPTEKVTEPTPDEEG